MHLSGRIAEHRLERRPALPLPVVRHLADAPGISPAELARRSFVTPQSMNELVLMLEAAGLVTRQPHPQHGRIRQAHLTASGRSKIAAARRCVNTIAERMLSSLTASEQRQLGARLIACIDNLTRRELSEPVPRPTR